MRRRISIPRLLLIIISYLSPTLSALFFLSSNYFISLTNGCQYHDQLFSLHIFNKNKRRRTQLYFHPLKGVRHEIFDFRISHELVSPLPLSILLGPFCLSLAISCSPVSLLLAINYPRKSLTPATNLSSITRTPAIINRQQQQHWRSFISGVNNNGDETLGTESACLHLKIK